MMMMSNLELDHLSFERKIDEQQFGQRENYKEKESTKDRSFPNALNADQLNELKVQMKRWERKFEKENKRKPTKDDIEKNEEIKESYIVYWKMVKISKKKTDSESNRQNTAWNDGCKKKQLKQTNELKSTGFVCKNKMVNSMLDKLMRNELKGDLNVKSSYSLKRPKFRTNDENKCISINSNRVSLLRRQSNDQQMPKDDFVSLIQISSHDNAMDTIDPLLFNRDEVRFTVESPPTLDLENLQQSTERNSIECNSTERNSTERNSTEHNSIEHNSASSDLELINTEREIQSELNSIVHKLNEESSFINSTYQLNNTEQIDRPISTIREHHQDEVDFGTFMPALFENFNASSRDQFNHNQDSQMTTYSPDYQPQYTELATSSSASIYDMDSCDFSPVKDIPSSKLTFSNVIKNFTNLHCDPTHEEANVFHVNNVPDVYDFEYQKDECQPEQTNDDVNKKQNVKEITKQKSTKRKKSKQQDQNFKRLDFKRKTYSRGHKKINMNKYKRNEWKKLQKENCCFKCGEKDHWAKDCTKVDQELKEIEQQDQNYDELEDLVFDQVIPNSTQPVFQEEDLAYNLQIAIKNALTEFGFQSFRPNQKEVIERILLGKSSMFISSTGTGKSLCYQLPAYLYARIRKYITIVVSPLISLMEDQMLCLPKCLKAVCLHSGLTEQIKKQNLQRIQSGEAQILFLSPEYILAHLYELSLLPTIGFVCIDEAHCLSEWSNNFRPSYLQFFNVLKEKMKINTFLALTATANKTTTKQILKNIDMSFEDDVIGSTKVPSNLVLTISRDTDKDFALISLLKSERFFNLNSIIIYCSRRETTEKIATLIRIEMQKSKDSTLGNQEWSASAYHAGFSYQERKRIQKSFIQGKLRVVVATIAFGMGINKSDVDGIIHFNLPKTIENYIQEIGRAGRDGKQAQCHVFLDHDHSDLFEQQKHIYSNGIDKINIKKLTSKLFKQCKCMKLKEELGQIYSNADGSVRRCPGHENAFSIKELTEELDIKEETLLTILIYLELNMKNIQIKVMNKTNSTCILSCYKGGTEQLEQLAKKHPFIALPVAQLKKANPTSDTDPIIRFSYINVASMLGQQSNEILKKLRNLEWKYEQNRRIKSNIRVAFEDPSFHVRTPGDLNEQEIEQVNQMILNYSRSQENLEIKRLKHFYEILKESSQAKCMNKINTNKSLKLKKVLNEYFDLNRTQSNTIAEEENLDDEENLNRLANETIILKQSNSTEIEEARRDIRDLINVHSDQYLTARSITRILQGISSPKFSAEVWGKDKRFWRKRIKMDFNLLFKIANEELVRIKCGT